MKNTDLNIDTFSTLLAEEVSVGKLVCDAQKMGMSLKGNHNDKSSPVAHVHVHVPVPMSSSANGANGAVECSETDVNVNANANQPLLNRKPPQYVRQQELAWHRVALEYSAQGYTAREIAGMLGCSPTAVQDILRQPQYQQTQVNLITKEVNKDREVVEHIKEKVLCAVETLSDIMEDAKAKPADRISAARELLNRRYGMPNQPINRNTDVDLNKLSDAELAQMLVGGTVTSTRLA